MSKKGSNDVMESAAEGLFNDAGAVVKEGQPAADREFDRSTPEKARVPLHALIVHFDARGSSDLPPADQED